MKYEELFEKYSTNNYIPYSDLLTVEEWKSKRETITKREGKICTSCKTASSIRYSNKNVYFTYGEYIQPENILKIDFGLKQFKEFLKIEKTMTDLEQMKYKYIVVADGNVSTYGYFWVLASGSVPLKQE